MNIRQATIEQLAKQVTGRRCIYCFGAGVRLTSLLRGFQEYHLEEHIKGISDNSREKQGTVWKFNEKAIPVMAPEHMIREMARNDIIIITAAKGSEIFQQLEGYDKLNNIDCYFDNQLRANQYDYERNSIDIPEVFTSRTDICIPKIIHYCWFGKTEIPEENRKWMESWKRYCPAYQIIEWNEDNYDVCKNLYMKQAYEKGKWAFVSDYARVDIVAQYGGVYLDTDVELLRNLDELLKNEAFCGFENKNFVNFGLGFGAIKNHKLIEKLREDYENRRFILENGVINDTPCPVYQTELLEQYGLQRNGQFQMLEQITVYPERVLCAMNRYSGRIVNNIEHSYSIHHFSASWKK